MLVALAGMPSMRGVAGAGTIHTYVKTNVTPGSIPAPGGGTVIETAAPLG
jgi:hypothetical protein